MDDTQCRDLADRAREVEREAGPDATHHELAQAFDQAAAALAGGHPHRDPLTWEAWLHQYQLPSSPQQQGARDPFMPFWDRGDGRGQHPPRVADFPVEAVEYFRGRLKATENRSARARLADFLWQRTRDIEAADGAITAYIAAAPAIPPSQPGTAPVEYLLRAATLSRSLGRDRADLRQAIRSLAELDEGSHLCSLVLATAEEIARDPDLADLLLGKLIAAADAAATAGGPQRDSERYALSAAIELATARHGATREFRRRRAMSFEHESTERPDADPIAHLFLLQEAMESYAALGMSDALDRVKAKVHEASQQASGNLHEMLVEQTIPRAELEASIEQLLKVGRGRSPWWHLQAFAIRGLWPDWSEIATQTAELARQAPLQAMVRQVVIGPDGRPYERPEDPEAARRFNEIRTYAQNIQFQLAIFAVQVAMMRERGVWTEELILNALRGGMLFPPDIIAAVQPGIRAFEAGRHWEAMHVLVPQVERVVRELARRLGEDTYRYVSTTGEIHWISLKALLQLERVRTELKRIRPDLPDELGYLLIDTRGLNLRDDVAHGISPADNDAERSALLCVMILVTLSIYVFSEELGAPGDTSAERGA